MLDTFCCTDPEGYFEAPEKRRGFQVFLERVIEGTLELEPLLEERLPGLRLPPGVSLREEFDDGAHPSATRLAVSGPDCFGLLYLVSRSLSAAGCNIELADVATPGGTACDLFFLTRGGGKLDDAAKRKVRQALSRL